MYFLLEIINDNGYDLPVNIEETLNNLFSITLSAHELDPECGAALEFVDAEAIRLLNRRFRGKDSVTDVLSFPSGEDVEENGVFLGDIAICFDRAVEQAEEFGHNLNREICFLAVHSYLHLLGYDHENEADERRMRERQSEILKSAGIER